MKTSFLRLLAAGSLLLAGVSFTGCRSAGYVDPDGPRTVVTLDSINIQDWSRAVDEMVASMVETGVLDRAPELPAVMAVSRITNNTSEQVDTDMLTRRIRVSLNRTNKVVTTTTVGLGGVAEDPLAQQEAEYRRFTQGDQAAREARPYWSLSGKILEDQVRAGRTRQTTYIFQLSLTEINTGLALWEDERRITKQGTRPAVGW